MATFLGGTASLAQPKTVLVPLCGKSKDMVYLQQSGYSVVGVELVPDAIFQFRAETSDEYGWLAPQQDRSGVRHATAYEVDGDSTGTLEVLEGDFFDLEALDDLEAQFDGCLDRAALVAIKPLMRPRYAARIQQLMKPGGRMLLIVFDYDQVGMELGRV